jgi:ribonucleoside-diphosphate reductase beta chain
VPATISIEVQQPPLDENWPKNTSVGGMQIRKRNGSLESVECEAAFGEDVLVKGVAGMSLTDLRKYLEYVADRRLESLGIMPVFGSNNPFDFMQLQDVQELANFFERRVSAYQLGVTGEVVFSEEF